MEVLKEEQLSDDEIFFGKFSLKEVKKCVLWNKQRDGYRELKNGGMDRSLKIIETHSAPDILHTNSNSKVTSPLLKATSNPVLSPLSSPNKWDKATDDSFLKIEKMVTDLCISQENSSVALDNTLDVIDYILKNGPAQNYDSPKIKSNDVQEEVCIDSKSVIPKVTVQESDTEKSPAKTYNSPKERNTPLVTPSKTDLNEEEDFATPCSNLNSDFKTPVFKTPGNLVSTKKTPHSLLKKSRSKASYKHVASPVASYINNCPKVPLIKDVRPSKPLPGHSAIPKFVKSTKENVKPSNKENVKLPTVAYKSAKKTEVIDIPDTERLPQCQWAKKLTSSLPRPLVMKHDHREMNIAKRMFMSKQNDRSFADLSLQQADVSVCTQKSAFNRPKKN